MHTSDKPLTADDLLKSLRKFNIQVTERGNKIFLFHPDINGKPVIYTMHKPHKRGAEYSRPIIAAVRRRFNISIDQLYNQ